MTEAKLTWSIWQALLNAFAWAFTRRGFHHFAEWITAMALNVEEHTITQSVLALEQPAVWKALESSPFNTPPVALSWEQAMDYVSPHHRGKDVSTIMYSRECSRHANAHAHARRSENFHRLETLLAQRRFQLIPMEILPHCAAVPLGVMVRGIMESLLDAEALEKLLQEYAPQQYTLELTIDALVSLLIQVSAGHRATVFAAYTADQASMPPTISTSYQALYAKLGRMDPKLSEAIVRFCAEKLRPVLEKLPCAAEPILAGYRTQILDGNVLTGTDHRLTALRQWLNACLPGKSLVVLEPDLGLISDLVLCEDAYTQERALLTYILERVQARDLLVFDRNFTTTGFAFGIADAAAPSWADSIERICLSSPSANWSSAGRRRRAGFTSRSCEPPIQTPARVALAAHRGSPLREDARWREDNWALD